VKNGCGGGGGRVASSGWGGVRRGHRAAATQAMLPKPKALWIECM